MRYLKYFLWLSVVWIIGAIAFPVGYFVLADKKVISFKDVSQPRGTIAYFINMDRSKERLAYILPNVQKLNLPFERIVGVDGAKLSQEDFAQAIDLDTYNKLLGYVLNPGVVGCALSHIKAWQQFLDSEHQFAIIFEDDVSFNASQVLTALENLKNNPQYWDIANLDTDLKGWPVTIKSFGTMKMVAYLSRVHHTGAYIINRYAAQKLLEKALPIKLPVDLYFNRGWELDLKFVGIEPRIVKQTFGDSTIEIIGKGNDYYKELKYKISRRLFIIQTNIMRFMYNLSNVIENLFI